MEDGYGVAVAKALGKIDQQYEARAVVHLWKRYGRGALLPLVSMALAKAMWEVCSSGFYHLQIRMVSSDTEEIGMNAKRYSSSIIWFKLFPEILERLEHGFTYCIYWFLQPKKGKDKVIFGNVGLDLHAG